MKEALGTEREEICQNMGIDLRSEWNRADKTMLNAQKDRERFHRIKSSNKITANFRCLFSLVYSIFFLVVYFSIHSIVVAV